MLLYLLISAATTYIRTLLMENEALKSLNVGQNRIGYVFWLMDLNIALP